MGKISLLLYSSIMQRFLKIGFLLILVISTTLAGCSASKKNCGCPNKKGMVGY